MKEYVLRVPRSRSHKKRKVRSRSHKKRNRYSGLTYLAEQLFFIGTIPIRLIPFGSGLIDNIDHAFFHLEEPIRYHKKKGFINFLADYGYNLIASPLELIPLFGHSIAKSMEHKLFFKKKIV